MQYVLIRGTNADELFGCNACAETVAAFLHNQTKQMQQLAVRLFEMGLPLRSFLSPYVDTVQLQNPSAAFFANQMLLFCENSQLAAIQNVCAKFKLFRISSAPEFSSLLKPTRLSTKRRALLEKELIPLTGTQPIFHLSFPSPALSAPFLLPQDRRAQAREVLAFGEICARVLLESGGKLLSCAGGTLTALLPENPSQIPQKLSALYIQRLAPHCGMGAQQPRLQIINP